MSNPIGLRVLGLELSLVLVAACDLAATGGLEPSDEEGIVGVDAGASADSGPDAAPTPLSPCVGISCSNRGTCVLVDDLPRCECDDGFEAVDLDCVEAPPEFPPAIDGDCSATGPFETTTITNTGPGNDYTIYRSATLGESGLRHPVITWGNGTGAVPSVYAGLLTHWASHGFVVVASNSTNTGSGQEMLDGVAWLVAENDRAGSDYYGVIATTRVGASGHSQGGGGTVAAGSDPGVSCTAPIEPWMGATDGSADALKGPTFTISGSSDTIVAASSVENQVYGPALVPAVYGKLLGATHFTPLGDAGDMRGPLTAWFRWHLMADDSAAAMFVGESCTLCVDPQWEIQRKNM